MLSRWDPGQASGELLVVTEAQADSVTCGDQGCDGQGAQRTRDPAGLTAGFQEEGMNVLGP